MNKNGYIKCEVTGCGKFELAEKAIRARFYHKTGSSKKGDKDLAGKDVCSACYNKLFRPM